MDTIEELQQEARRNVYDEINKQVWRQVTPTEEDILQMGEHEVAYCYQKGLIDIEMVDYYFANVSIWQRNLRNNSVWDQIKNKPRFLPGP